MKKFSFRLRSGSGSDAYMVPKQGEDSQRAATVLSIVEYVRKYLDYPHRGALAIV